MNKVPGKANLPNIYCIHIILGLQYMYCLLIYEFSFILYHVLCSLGFFDLELQEQLSPFIILFWYFFHGLRWLIIGPLWRFSWHWVTRSRMRLSTVRCRYHSTTGQWWKCFYTWKSKVCMYGTLIKQKTRCLDWMYTFVDIVLFCKGLSLAGLNQIFNLFLNFRLLGTFQWCRWLLIA